MNYRQQSRLPSEDYLWIQGTCGCSNVGISAITDLELCRNHLKIYLCCPTCTSKWSRIVPLDEADILSDVRRGEASRRLGYGRKVQFTKVGPSKWPPRGAIRFEFLSEPPVGGEGRFIVPRSCAACGSGQGIVFEVGIGQHHLVLVSHCLGCERRTNFCFELHSSVVPNDEIRVSPAL